MNKSIIFDLDGTLWDSSSQVVTAWNRALHKCPDIDYEITVKDMKGFMGKTADVIAKLAFKHVSEERGMEIIGYCLKEEVNYIRKHGGTLYPNLEETLQLLGEKYQLAIVSNCQLDYLKAFLEFHKLDRYFCDYECAGRTKRPKGENIKLIIRRNHFEQAVYIGDTQGDYDAAKSANVQFFHAAYGFGMIEGGMYRTINAFAELPKAVAEILK